jgi:DNA repair protein RadC
VGTVNLNLIHPREVFYPAVQYLASSVILAHNHPSGDTNPSDEDIKVTAELKEAARIMGIELTDHLIIAYDAYSSMKECGFL